jgi:hypothetical protein
MCVFKLLYEPEFSALIPLIALISTASLHYNVKLNFPMLGERFLKLRALPVFNSAAVGQIFTNFYICIFKKTVEKIQVSPKYDKNNEYFARRHFYNILLSSA